MLYKRKVAEVSELEEIIVKDITVRRPVIWVSSSATNVGTVRSINEDAILDLSEQHFWCVADGMGGHDAGNVASNMIVESFADMELPDRLNESVAKIENIILDVNHRLL